MYTARMSTQASDNASDSAPKSAPDNPESRPAMEPLTPEEMEAFLSRVRAEGRSLTSAEQYALFGPREEAPAPAPVEEVDEMEAAFLDEAQIAALAANFFPELTNGHDGTLPASLSSEQPLLQGIIFDFDYTLAYLPRQLDSYMEEGARAAEAYMRSTGMEFPDEFWAQIVEARRFAQKKSEDEREEHIADDAMSFLLQFYGYPASKLDRDVLSRAVDIFYAPEMTAWRVAPETLAVLGALRDAGYKLAIVANYNCDRVFQRTIDYLGLRPYFDVVLASASVEYRKPDETLFQIVLERWDLLPYEVVVVGDSLPHDVAGGLELGALAVQSTQYADGAPAQIEYDNEQVAETIRPDAVIDDLAQLPALVQAWATA